MTWTATLDGYEKAPADGVWFYRIVFTNGVSKTVRTYRADRLADDVVKASMRNGVAELEAMDVEPELTLVKGEPVDLAVTAKAPPVVVVTPEQEFFAAYRTLQQLQRAAAAGMIKPDDPRIATAMDLAKALWLDDYLAMM